MMAQGIILYAVRMFFWGGGVRGIQLVMPLTAMHLHASCLESIRFISCTPFFEGGCGVWRVLVNIYIDYPNARLCSSKEVSFKIRVAEGADKS